MVEVYLSSSVSLGDLLCNKEHATRPAHVDVELYRTPDGNSEPSDDDQTYYAGDLPRRQVGIVSVVVVGRQVGIVSVVVVGDGNKQ